MTGTRHGRDCGLAEVPAAVWQRELLRGAHTIEELALALLIGVRGQTLISVSVRTGVDPEVIDVQVATVGWLGEIAEAPDIPTAHEA